MKSNWIKILPCVLLSSVANGFTITPNMSNVEIESNEFRIRAVQDDLVSSASPTTSWKMNELLFYSDAACEVPIAFDQAVIISRNKDTQSFADAQAQGQMVFDQSVTTVGEIQSTINNVYQIGYKRPQLKNT